MIGVSENQKELMTAQADANDKYTESIARINQQIRELEAGPQTAASKAKIDALTKEKAEITAIYQIQSSELPKVIGNKQAELALDRERLSQLEKTYALSDRLKSIEDETNKLTLTDREKKYYDIRAANNAAAEAQIRNEQKMLATGESLSKERIKQIQDQADAYTQAEIAKQTAQYDTARSFQTGWESAYNNFIENGTNAATRAEQVFSTMTGAMNNAIDRFVETGKFSFADFSRSVIQELLKIQLKAAAINMIKSFGDTGGGSFLSSLLGFAEGGVIQTNKPVLVGENGPELISGAAGMTVTPNGRLGGGQQNITNNYYTVNAVDAKSVAQLFAENRKTLLGTVRQAEKELPIRGR